MADKTTGAGQGLVGAMASDIGRVRGGTSSPRAGESKGLAEYGYTREGYLDRDYLDSLVTPIAPRQPTTPPTTTPEGETPTGTTPTTMEDKLADYAAQRIEARQKRVEDMTSSFLAGDSESAKLYKDLYDSYYLLSDKEEEPLTRAQYVSKLTNMTSKLPTEKAEKAFEERLAEWKEDPAAFRKAQQESGIIYGSTALDDYLTSKEVGDVMGWDENAYMRGASLSGLTQWAESSRAISAQREAEQAAEMERLRQLAAQRNTFDYRADHGNSASSKGNAGMGIGGPSGGGGYGGFGGSASGGMTV